MAIVQAYWGILAQNMTNPQKTTLVTAMRGIGDNSSEQPNRRNHSRSRNDNNAMLFEAAFDEANLGIASVKNFLATTFSISAASISHSINSTVYGDTITFTYLTLDRLTLICFGMSNGNWPSVAVSRQKAFDYLVANLAQWDAV